MNPEIPLRQAPEVRKKSILDAAVKLSKKFGYSVVTREQIADKAKCAPGLVSHYLGNMSKIKSLVMEYAIENKVLEIILQGLVNKDRRATKAPESLKEKARKVSL